ncbi:venom acid phosphatase Acph-1-like [Trichogramma pretiosum]|uniref:venom acid phosphatase Acph-1-like n=1 Tax=Trichogramma pretiosum TaxID=7493 RepID=UPI0006C9CEEA|nr:venom acid phosphatase Acph-1-like [Trichogramma pretiosum]
MGKFFFLLCLLAVQIYLDSATPYRGSLKKISVVFRHGDRLPEPPPLGYYPNDPYLNTSFYPLHAGDLTNSGKRREFEIGRSLRKRYNEFLGPYYDPTELSATSTDFTRTKMSLLMVLAGLYPPKDKQVWIDGIDWQPIPFFTMPHEVNAFLRPTDCLAYQKERARVQQSAEYQKDLLQFGDLMKNLTVLMGREVNDTKAIFHLFHTLMAEREMGLELPEWTKIYFPNGPVIGATVFHYRAESYSPLMKKLHGGTFLRKMLNDLSIDDIKKTPKIHLYSAHENNLAGILIAMDSWWNFIPEYSSAIVFELHEVESQYYIQVVYYYGIPTEFEELVIPGCDQPMCPIEEFLDLMADVMPDDILEACLGKPEESLFIPKDGDLHKWFYSKMRKWFNL